MHELSLSNYRQRSEQQALEKATKDTLEAEAEVNTLLGECSVFCDMMGLEVDFSEVEDDIISRGMRDLASWQDQMNTIERAFRKFENVQNQLS